MEKDRKLNEFIESVQKVLKESDLRENFPFKDSDVWQSTKELEQTEYFVLKKSASHYYFTGLKLIRKKLDENNVEVSDTYINNYYFKFIEKQKRTEKNLKENCKYFLDGIFSLKPKTFRYLIPMSHYDYRKDLDFGKIRVVRLTDETFEKYFPNNKDRISIQNIKTLNEGNKTEIFAIVDTESIEGKNAEEKAYRLVERFIYGTKLIDPGTFVRLRKNTMIEIHEHVLIKTDTGISNHLLTHNSEGRLTPDDKFYTKFQPYWDQLVTFLFNDNLNELQEVILSALYWYGETDFYSDTKVKQFLNLITGLEIVILHNSSDIRKKAVPFGKICARIFSGDEKYWEFWKKYYFKRSDIIHQELVDIYKEEIDTLKINLRSILLQLIEHSKTYDNLSELFKQEFGINS